MRGRQREMEGEVVEDWEGEGRVGRTEEEGEMLEQREEGVETREGGGRLKVMMRIAAGGEQARAQVVVTRVGRYVQLGPEIARVTSVGGWRFAGSGQNVAMCIVELRDWG
ncbi:hypothetical protein, partial [Paraburkholderia ginsengiterrae]|uniref:hypothetical protein n=1 Tax=Paraburkholderia ginsengiterrae TaxID=1462993 RepID=UPI001ABFAF1F